MNPNGEHATRAWGDLISSIVSDMGKLLAHDLELARSEIQAGASRLKAVMAMLAIGALLAVAGVFMLVFALVHLLNETTAIPLWASYAIVGVAVIVAGGGLALIARSRAARIDVTPQRAAEAFKEDCLWMGSRISQSWQNVNRREPH